MNAKRTSKSSRQSLQIIAGEYRHRKIHLIEADGLRPTGARIRETLFNWLQGQLYDKTCLDLFAGSGILGLEALSRGAKHVTFVEKNSHVFRQLKENTQMLGINNATLLNADFSAALSQPHDVVFLDPPYQLRLLPTLLTQIKPLSPRYIFIEDNQPFATWVEESGDYEILKNKKAGGIYYGLLTPIKA